jgi:hypothetical protein
MKTYILFLSSLLLVSCAVTIPKQSEVMLPDGKTWMIVKSNLGKCENEDSSKFNSIMSFMNKNEREEQYKKVINSCIKQFKPQVEESALEICLKIDRIFNCGVALHPEDTILTCYVKCKEY